MTTSAIVLRIEIPTELMTIRPAVTAAGNVLGTRGAGQVGGASAGASVGGARGAGTVGGASGPGRVG